MNSIRFTPAGMQRVSELAWRRRFVAVVNLVVYAVLLAWLAHILSHGGWSLVDAAILLAFAIAAPWSVLGVCNAAIGFWLLHFRRAGLIEAAPFMVAADKGLLRARVAMLLTVRNEDARRAFGRFRAVKGSVDATGDGAAFDWFVLSDTSDPHIAAQEEHCFEDWRAEARDDAARLHYRRRSKNVGYKAGNIRNFCENSGAPFEFMVPLDADSLMDGKTILRLLRICEAYPRLGILQSLVVGAPSQSAFARIFQFGMRHGMRTYTMGAAWWAGDCGPFWGHNAIVRIKPFLEHCVLPRLEHGRHILSHDQIEAVLMRRAGFEVRLAPIECGSFEENPPTLLDFVQRDLRWCAGNMQYLRLLGLPGIPPMSRFQLIWAVSMFIGAPAWTTIIALVPFAAMSDASDGYPYMALAGLYLLFLGFYLAPKIAGFVDVALTPGGLLRYGGAVRFLVAALCEVGCSFVIGAVTTLHVSLLLAGLLFGRSVDWGEQAREVRGLSWRSTARALRPHLLFGVILYALGAAFAPKLLLWSLPVTLGYLVAIPFAVITASPSFGAWLVRARLFVTPEEIAPPHVLVAVKLFADKRAGDNASNVHVLYEGTQGL